MSAETDKKQGPNSGQPSKPGRLELFFFPDCPYCRKVLGTIDELGIKDKLVFHDARTDPKEKEALVELTGKTQVPCLVIDGKPMHESEDIKQYLIQIFSG